MQNKTVLLPYLGIFLLAFLLVFLVREINLTGESTRGVILVKNKAPLLLTPPRINNSSPGISSKIECLPGQYFDMDGHAKYKDYFTWYRNNLLIASQYSSFLDLSLAGSSNPGDVLRCTQRTSDGFSNGTWHNSSAVTVLGASGSTTTTILSSVGGGGGGGSSTSIIPGCVPDFSCNPWTECVNSSQSTECIDIAGCLPSRKETRYCSLSQQISSTILEQEAAEIIEIYSIITITLTIIAFILFIILVIAAIILSRRHASASDEKGMHLRSDLLTYVKQALDRGYSPGQIQDSLLKAGWPRDMIDQAFKEVT